MSSLTNGSPCRLPKPLSMLVRRLGVGALCFLAGISLVCDRRLFEPPATSSWRALKASSATKPSRDAATSSRSSAGSTCPTTRIAVTQAERLSRAASGGLVGDRYRREHESAGRRVQRGRSPATQNDDRAQRRRAALQHSPSAGRPVELQVRHRDLADRRARYRRLPDRRRQRHASRVRLVRRRRRHGASRTADDFDRQQSDADRARQQPADGDARRSASNPTSTTRRSTSSTATRIRSARRRRGQGLDPTGSFSGVGTGAAAARAASSPVVAAARGAAAAAVVAATTRPKPAPSPSPSSPPPPAPTPAAGSSAGRARCVQAELPGRDRPSRSRSS